MFHKDYQKLKLNEMEDGKTKLYITYCDLRLKTVIHTVILGDMDHHRVLTHM